MCVKKKLAIFQFKAELNDFLPVWRRGQAINCFFFEQAAVKDIIESMGIPHSEVDVILANGVSVGLEYHLVDHDQINVYPITCSPSSLGIIHLLPVRKLPIRFVLDVHLGKLAKWLRVLGFDTDYHNHYCDQQIIDIERYEQRIILTRDIGLLKHKSVIQGYWVRSTQPIVQVKEVIHHFDLKFYVLPFSRCLLCNHLTKPINKSLIMLQLPAKTKRYFHKFSYCHHCDKIYWQGSHYDNMLKRIKAILV